MTGRPAANDRCVINLEFGDSMSDGALGGQIGSDSRGGAALGDRWLGSEEPLSPGSSRR